MYRHHLKLLIAEKREANFFFVS